MFIKLSIRLADRVKIFASKTGIRWTSETAGMEASQLKLKRSEACRKYTNSTMNC